MNTLKILSVLALGMICGSGLTSMFLNKQTTAPITRHVQDEQRDKTPKVEKTNETQQLQAKSEVKPTLAYKPEVRFVENATIVPAVNYEELLQSVDADTEALYQKLNDEFYNLFQFNNAEEYRRLLASGMPTPEELAYVYQTDIEILKAQIREISLTEDTPEITRLKREKLTSLVFNRAMEELAEKVKYYHDDYQVGDMIPGLSQIGEGRLPSDMEQAINNVTYLWGEARGGMATTSLARARFVELNLFNVGEDRKYQILTHIASVESLLYTSHVFKNYEKRNDVSKSSKDIYSNIVLALYDSK